MRLRITQTIKLLLRLIPLLVHTQVGIRLLQVRRTTQREREGSPILNELSDCKEDSEGEQTKDEAYHIGLDDVEDNDMDAQAEYVALRESKIKRRLERLRRNKADLIDESIKHCPIGIDKGLEAYINEGNLYSGYQAGDEDYIRS